MPVIRFPTCELCGMADPYFCKLCGGTFCGECMGEFNKCQHKRFIPLVSDDWNVTPEE